MRLIVAISSFVAMVLVSPQESLGKIAVIRTRITAIHARGSQQGGKFGGLTLAWGNEGGKPQLRTVLLMEHTKMTAPGKEGRVPIRLEDLKPGMIVVTEMSANRVGDTR
jgi:hypothetical protein